MYNQISHSLIDAKSLTNVNLMKDLAKGKPVLILLSNQMIRGVVSPHGTGKDVKVLVIPELIKTQKLSLEQTLFR